jgi:hypothetical protein
MPLVPTDYPTRLAQRGLTVHVQSGWESRGGSADHKAVVLHHTASSSGTSPKSDADYCTSGASDAPLYNVLVDRNGEAWVLARKKSNSSGKISGTALNEVLAGKAGATSAAARGLSDTTSANDRLWAVSAQNNGTGEHWSDALNRGMAICAAVALECLGLESAGYVTQHRVLTARKIDCCGDACPADFQPLVTQYLSGGGGPIPGAPGNLLEVGMFIAFGPNGAALVGAGYWCNLDQEGYDRFRAVPGMVVQSVDQRGWDVLHAGATHGQSADDPLT